MNSDVLFHQRLVVERLSNAHTAFLDACREGGHAIVLPLTTRLEFDHYQAKSRREEIRSIDGAYATLLRHGIPFEARNAAELFPAPDLVALIGSSGVVVEVVEPRFDEFVEAHRRACLHEAPQAPETKSDEMRDLLIWLIALRVAAEDGGALLLSRDQVHVGTGGNDEAGAVGLVRLRTLDEALAYFGVVTPAGQALLEVLRSAWQVLMEQGLPLADEPTLLRADRPVFVSGGRGPSSIRAFVELPTQTNGRLSARLGVLFRPEGMAEVALSSIRADGEDFQDFSVTARTQGLSGSVWQNYGERLSALRASLWRSDEHSDG